MTGPEPELAPLLVVRALECVCVRAPASVCALLGGPFPCIPLPGACVGDEEEDCVRRAPPAKLLLLLLLPLLSLLRARSENGLRSISAVRLVGALLVMYVLPFSL